MKCQILFSEKNISKCHLLKFLPSMQSDKASVTTVANDNFEVLVNFSEKTSLDISYESSTKKAINLKGKDLLSPTTKRKAFLECRLLQISLGNLRVNYKSTNRNTTADDILISLHIYIYKA